MSTASATVVQPAETEITVRRRRVKPARIALQAFLAAQLGLAIGARIGERWRERAEQAAGVALILLGGYLIIEQLAAG